jgi:peptide deformylase
MSDPKDLQIIVYPDPRLKKRSKPIEKFDAELTALANRMFDLMREAKGVGLAAPQVGINLQLFVMNPTGKPVDDRVYINPSLSEASGEETEEEGCLSLPEIRIDVSRSKILRMEAKDLKGEPILEEATGYIARIWQHEFDHLQGTMLTDRMGPVDRLKYRKAIKELEEIYEKAHPPTEKTKTRSKRRR